METTYPYPFTNSKGKVLCQMCGKPFLIISPRHLKRHEVTLNEYKLRFPDAPISGEEFNAQSLHGKNKNLFLQNGEDVEEVTVSLETEPVEEIPEPIVEEEINIEELYNKTLPQQVDHCDASKDKILDHLNSFFSNMKKDHLIQIYTMDNRLLHEFISDFADPVLKINFEFPKTFWHNRMNGSDEIRDLRLKENGWKVIRNNSRNPTYQDIEKIIDGLKLMS